MLELTGKNLPNRQQELNIKVKEAVTQNVDFNDLKLLEEKSDVDRLFKIDVASEYKNAAYILEMFTSGDSLYISRALKSSWLYSEEYVYIINPDYLHKNIFPSMSVKMTKKLLTTISKNIRSEERALSFYKYCCENKFQNIANKFLLFTSEKHKLEYLEKKTCLDYSIDIPHFVGDSFCLAEKCSNRRILLSELCYLYSVCSERYLDLFESSCDHSYGLKFGRRISKSILTKQKHRVTNNPALYIEYLDINMILKYSTVEDAKLYLKTLLPDKAVDFWPNFSKYSGNSKKMISIMKLLPENDKYNFLKQIFITKYLAEPFESSHEFYNNNMFELMTCEEREVWALTYIKENTEFLGSDQEFIWCKYVSFELAFKEIKKYILLATDHFKRTQMLSILVGAARTEEDLEKVINYYYDRHINERGLDKVDFVEKICENHNVFKFKESCWTAFNKILHSMKVYTKDFFYDQFRTLSIVYHILNNKEIPDTLQVEIITETRLHYFNGHLRKLTKDEINLVYKYYLNLLTSKAEAFAGQEYDKNNVRTILSSVLLILNHFKKTKDDCPEIIMKYIKLDWDYFKHSEFLVKKENITESYLIRLLKQDAKLLLSKLTEAKKGLSIYSSLRLNSLMKKIKIYFSNDIARDCLNTFEKWLSDVENITYVIYRVTICSIFQIADEDYKINFMSKYTPTDAKIAHDRIDQHVLRIQESICRFAHYSRPPIPLQELLKFIKGDYVHFCLPMFGFYVMNLPPPMVLQFIAAILNTPVSVQKHGLRLAFQCFNPDELKKLVLDCWGRTKNVSLRKVLYKGLYDRVTAGDDAIEDFYELLKLITLQLSDDDDDEIFGLLCSVSSLPEHLKGDYLQTAWKAVQKLSDKNIKNFDRKREVIKKIQSNIDIMDKEFCRSQILDDFIKSMLVERKIHVEYKNYKIVELIQEMWTLAVKYILHFDNQEQLSRSLELASFIIKKCVEMWDCVSQNIYTTRKFLIEFLDTLLNESYCDRNKGQAIPVLQNIMKELRELIPIREIYIIYCKFTFVLVSKEVMGTKNMELLTNEISSTTYTDIAQEFTDKLVTSLMDLKQNQMLYTSFYSQLASEISQIIISMTYDTELKSECLLAQVCERLTDVQMFETYALALLIFPTEIQTAEAEVLPPFAKKIKKNGNEECQTMLWNTILSSGNYRPCTWTVRRN
ncbi:unnamed protein product, partial [Brenthis ino]